MDNKLHRMWLAGLVGLTLALAVLWLSAAAPARADPNVHCVNGTGTGCLGACGSCYNTVQAAVNAAAPGHIIQVAEGGYATGGTVAVITKPLGIIGGFSADFTLHEPPTRTTVFDGQQGGSVVSIITATEVTLQHLTIIQGDGTGNTCDGGSGGCGGGVYVYSTTLHLEHCVIANNVGSDAGTGKGGGVYVFDPVGTQPTADIHDCIFEGNTASTDGPGSGGGMWLHTANASAPASIINNEFMLNTGSTVTRGLGGGAFQHYYATYQDNTFEGNAGSRAADQDGAAGGLYLWYAPSVTLDRNRFLDNVASEYGTGAGGAIQGYSLVVFTMTNNLLVNNQANGKGDTIYLDGWRSDRQIDATMVNNTIINDAGPGTEGIYVTHWVDLTLLNNIIAGHTVGVTNTNPVNSSIYAEANLLWNGADPIVGINAVQQDPLLLPDHHLDVASPAINRGVTTWVGSDIDGDARPDWCFFDIGFDEFITGLGCTYVHLPLVVRNY